MRIIGGTHRSRLILSPAGSETTRPITDRVKQSVFDRLVTMETMGGNVLDIFAGTGSLGLEALSRGGDYCIFVESQREPRDLLEQNLKELGFANQASILRVDASSGNWTALIHQRPLRLIFCDPPYPLSDDAAKLKRLARVLEHFTTLAEEDAVLVLRTRDRVPGPVLAGWVGPDTVIYGSMAVHFYRAAPPGQAQPAAGETPAGPAEPTEPAPAAPEA